MVEQTSFKGRDAHECKECGFKYTDRKTAEERESFCRTYGSRPIKITKKALR